MSRRCADSPLVLPTRPDLSFEQQFWQAGLLRVAGLDEAGRGALAGPVAAAAVILPPDPCIAERLRGVRDSKQMSPAQREHWAGEIRAAALAWAVGLASCEEIDRINILQATRLAMSRALSALVQPPQALLLDALRLPGCDLPQVDLIKGDNRSLSIAAASVLAKTARDTLLTELECEFPGYGFAAHKGYGTAVHLAAISALGPCPQHRLTFAPLRSVE